MLIKELWKEDSTWIDSVGELAQKIYWDDVYKQSTNHTRRKIEGETNHIIDKSRPNEQDQTKEFRLDNERAIAKDGFDTFFSKSARQIVNTSFEMKNLSDDSKEWFDENNFVYLGESMSFKRWAFDCLYRNALDAPNDLIFAFPYNKDNELAPPNSSLSPNEKVGIMPIIISHKDVVHIGKEYLAFIGGQVLVSQGKAEIEEDFYYCADKEWWYALIPKYVKQPKGGYKKDYDLIEWYKHDMGEVPTNFMPGEKSKSIDNKVLYHESLIHSYYIWCDEAIDRFSDGQIVHKRFSYPLVAMKPVQCYHKECRGGTLYDDKGKVKRDANGKNVVCHVCKGNGKVSYPSPQGTIIKPEKNMNSQGASDSIVDYYNPDPSFAKTAYETPFDLLDLAKRSIGLDLMVGAGANSSAEALRERRVDLIDLLTRISQALFHTLETFSWHVECLLVPTVSQRKRASFHVPTDFEIRSETELKEIAEKALPEDRIKSRMKHYEVKYANDSIAIHYYNALLRYSPYLTLTDDEIKLRQAKGICTPEDIAKRDYGTLAILDLMDEGDEERTFKDIHEDIDNWLIERGLIKDPNQEEEVIDDAERNALLERVGGVSEVLKVIESVSGGEQSPDGAKVIFTSIFGMSEDDANELVDNININEKQGVLNDGAEASPNGTIPQDQEGGEAENGQSQNGQEDGEGSSNVNDLLELYIQGVINIDTATSQIVEITGRSEEEVRQILESEA